MACRERDAIGTTGLRVREAAMIVLRVGKYMTSEAVGTSPRDTYIIHAKDGSTLATVEWYPRWRQYVVDPERGAVFSADCLRDLATFCEAMAKIPTVHNVAPASRSEDDLPAIPKSARNRGEPPTALCVGCRLAWSNPLGQGRCVLCGQVGMCSPVCPCMGVRRDARALVVSAGEPG